VSELIRTVEVPKLSVQVNNRLVEIPRIQYLQKNIEVPEVFIRDKIVEVPTVEIQEVVTEVPRVEVCERIHHVPKIVVQEVVRTVPKIINRIVEKIVEVPEIRTVEKIVEVPEIRKVNKFVDVPHVQVVEAEKRSYRPQPRPTNTVVEQAEALPQLEVVTIGDRRVPVLQDVHLKAMDVVQLREHALLLCAVLAGAGWHEKFGSLPTSEADLKDWIQSVQNHQLKSFGGPQATLPMRYITASAAAGDSSARTPRRNPAHPALQGHSPWLDLNGSFGNTSPPTDLLGSSLGRSGQHSVVLKSTSRDNLAVVRSTLMEETVARTDSFSAGSCKSGSARWISGTAGAVRRAVGSLTAPSPSRYAGAKRSTASAASASLWGSSICGDICGSQHYVAATATASSDRESVVAGPPRRSNISSY